MSIATEFYTWKVKTEENTICSMSYNRFEKSEWYF